jgi:hypothetical protein
VNRYDIAVHKSRVLASIRREERKRETHPPKDRPVSFRRARTKVRWDKPLPWEENHALRD